MSSENDIICGLTARKSINPQFHLIASNCIRTISNQFRYNKIVIWSNWLLAFSMLLRTAAILIRFRAVRVKEKKKINSLRLQNVNWDSNSTLSWPDNLHYAHIIGHHRKRHFFSFICLNLNMNSSVCYKCFDIKTLSFAFFLACANLSTKRCCNRIITRFIEQFDMSINGTLFAESVNRCSHQVKDIDFFYFNNRFFHLWKESIIFGLKWIYRMKFKSTFIRLS